MGKAEDLARKAGVLAEIVQRENSRQRMREYNLHLNRGKWINLNYMERGGMMPVDVIRKDTPATLEGYDAAIKAMTACAAASM